MPRPKNESGIAREEQATLRAPRDVVDDLRLIAAKEKTTLFDIVTVILSDYVARYNTINPAMAQLSKSRTRPVVGKNKGAKTATAKKTPRKR